MNAKKAKRLMYVWGKAKTTLLERAILATGSADGHAVIHCDKLFLAIRKGLKNFVASADNNPQLALRLQEAASFQYDNVLV